MYAVLDDRGNSGVRNAFALAIEGAVTTAIS
jgi:hypothetical protein